MNFREFQNYLKKLRFIDRHQLESFKIIPQGDHNAWGKFRMNPYRYFIQAPDEVAEKIWEIIK